MEASARRQTAAVAMRIGEHLAPPPSVPAPPRCDSRGAVAAPLVDSTGAPFGRLGTAMNNVTPRYGDARPLPTSTIVAWATGAFGVAGMMNGIPALILFYLMAAVKLNPAVAGFLVPLSRLYDAVSDPFSG